MAHRLQRPASGRPVVGQDPPYGLCLLPAAPLWLAGRPVGVWSVFMDLSGRPVGVWGVFIDPSGRPVGVWGVLEKADGAAYTVRGVSMETDGAVPRRIDLGRQP